MSTYVVKVPDVGEGVAEVELVSWAVAPGDTVKKHQILAEVMTDKANVEIPAPAAGTVAQLTGEAGDVLAVGSDLVQLTVDGDAPAAVPAAPTVPDGPTPVVEEPVADSPNVPGNVERVDVVVPPTPSRLPASDSRSEPSQRPTAAPAVRAHAKALGIDLRTIVGSGPNGRILHEDLEGAGHASGSPSASLTNIGEGTAAKPTNIEPLIGMRRRIAERMLTATTTIPHITYVEEVDMTALMSLREELNSHAPADTPKLSILPFLIRAVTASVPDVPYINAHVDDDAGEIRTFDQVDVGIATQTPRGLVVPVLRAAEQRSLWDLAGRVGELAASAKEGSIAASDLSGSTITISSLGELGGIISTPIINKPETAIVGVNKLVTRPVWQDGQFVPRKMMNLSSSFDHRVVDGFDAASFIVAVKRLLEQPALLFID